MQSKIQNIHKEKMACIYLRQSTMGQVIHHRESTERQYALKDRALLMGWELQKIKILDQDLGLSGTQMENREAFKSLVADVSMNKVGAIFALEASRLSRSSTDWNRLFELCSITNTLIIDEDGCYDPANFNDQLLLGLKGIMSQAELHFIRVRLLGAKQNKAKKGELHFPLPVGFCYDNEGKISFDPDNEVQNSIKMVFKFFKETGSAYGVVQTFGKNSLKFPKRAYGGIWKGKLVWGRLTYTRILNILKNPSYAGVYVYGRYRYEKKISTDGKILSKIKTIPMSQWQVCIKEHHQGYINWQDYINNQKTLHQNRTNDEVATLNSPAREGLTLLQGLLVCSICGRHLTIRYMGNGGLYPTYHCNWKKREGLLTTSCISFRADIVDKAISIRVLEILQKDKLEIALKALDELTKRNNTMNTAWKMRIERAEYEANLAQRRYEEVDPANRLVASNLEKQWNDKLLTLEEVKDQYNIYTQKNKLNITEEQKSKILMLAQDLPKLWNASTTSAKDRKRIIRLLIKDITVEKEDDSRKLILHVRWQGGATEDILVNLPKKIYEKWRYSEEIVNKVRNLAKSYTDSQIVNLLNNEGLVSAKGKSFTKSMISWIRYKHNISVPHLKEINELTVEEVANKFKIKKNVIYYWIEKGYIKARKVQSGYPYWITLDSEKDLLMRIKNSYKLKT
jgi:DNA invertase Pin-like site-specific DNA recombinase